jgi:hypothetical protein
MVRFACLRELEGKRDHSQNSNETRPSTRTACTYKMTTLTLDVRLDRFADRIGTLARGGGWINS